MRVGKTTTPNGRVFRTCIFVMSRRFLPLLSSLLVLMTMPAAFSASIEAITFNAEPGKLFLPVDEAVERLKWPLRRDDMGNVFQLNEMTLRAGSLRSLTDGTELVSTGATGGSRRGSVAPGCGRLRARGRLFPWLHAGGVSAARGGQFEKTAASGLAGRAPRAANTHQLRTQRPDPGGRVPRRAVTAPGCTAPAFITTGRRCPGACRSTAMFSFTASPACPTIPPPTAASACR
jgi:hypothetical protein